MLAGTRSWAVHQVIHFSAAKMANDNAHMNSHAGMRLRKLRIAAGNATRGSHPGQAVVPAALLVLVCEIEFK
jgi:hypothetical protein